MKKTFLLSYLMLAAMPVMAAYTGHVYVDKNKNGVFDQSEKPLAGINAEHAGQRHDLLVHCNRHKVKRPSPSLFWNDGEGHSF